MIPQGPRRDMARDDAQRLDIAARRWGNMLRVRLYDGARKYGVRWQHYADEDNRANLLRAVTDLEAALVAFRSADGRQEQDGAVYGHLLSELPKRAADVANQAFMLADIHERDGSIR